LARSRPRARLPEDSSRTGTGAAPSLSAATVPRVWQGIGYRPLPDPAQARPLFDYAALPWPARDVAFAWGAADGGDRLIGAAVVERSGTAAMLDGPVIVAGADPLEVAAQLLAPVLDHATPARLPTVHPPPQTLPPLCAP